MYRKHFGLTQHPFSNEIEPEELFLATSYKELEVRLAHLIDMRGIGLVTGDSGSGKTCCCRKVLHALHASLYRVLYVCLSTGNVMDLYKTISWEMGLPVERSRAALFRQIRAEVTRLVSEARCRPILVIDEAHHLRPEVLEELRLLTNYNMDAENRLCLLLLLFITLNREDFSFVIHLDWQPRTSRRREAQTGSRARSGSRSERTLDAVEHSRTLMEWWPFLIFHRGGLRIKVINNNCSARAS